VHLNTDPFEEAPRLVVHQLFGGRHVTLAKLLALGLSVGVGTVGVLPVTATAIMLMTFDHYVTALSQWLSQ
jgi:hypothetical protein